MAPELRKRKGAAAAAPKKDVEAPAKSATKAEAKGKRKAIDQASPVSAKKQKPVKKAAAEAKVSEKPTKSKSKKAAQDDAEMEEPAQDESVLRVSDDESDSEEEGVQELAAQLDPANEEETGKEVFKPGQDVGKIPKPARQPGKRADGTDQEPGVVYIGRIPHGFYEHEMRQYFTQFGPINQLRLSRNKKTGASKHFAFVEFAETTTAEIAAKTMDNYLLFGHILKCKLIPKEQVRSDLFKGGNRRFKKIPWNQMAGRALEKPKTESAWEAKRAKETSKRQEKAAKLKELGYDFEAPELKSVPAPVAPAAIENGAEEPKAIEDAPAAEEKEESNGKEEVEEPKVEEAAEPKVEEAAEPKKGAAKPKAKVARSSSRSKKAKA